MQGISIFIFICTLILRNIHCVRDFAAMQLMNYSKHHGMQGQPLIYNKASLTVGRYGPMVLYDGEFLKDMTRFTRERIPERVVHASGSGAFGYFEITHDVTQFTKASVFSYVGKKTDVVVRFSSTLGEKGSADTVRGPHGFAVKFYTEDGNFDIPGLDQPIFFIRDGILFSSLVHSQKRNPVTNIPDVETLWDFLSLRPEGLAAAIKIFQDRGLPNCYEHMEGYSIHALKLVNRAGNYFYAKFVFRPNQGFQSLTDEHAAELRGSDPDHCQRTLYNSIALNQFPSWNVYLQIITPTQAKNYLWNVFDVTKEWTTKMFPIIPVGVLVLNRNPENYFEQVEKLAFNIGNMIPGIEPSPDRVLQARMFAYPDAQKHRLGPDFWKIPVNCPLRTNFTSDDGPNYFPNTFGKPDEYTDNFMSAGPVSGYIDRYDLGDEDNYSEIGRMWREMKIDEQKRVINRLAGQLEDVSPHISARIIREFSMADAEFGYILKRKIQKN